MGLTSLYLYLGFSAVLVAGVIYCLARLLLKGKSARWLAAVCFLVVFCIISYFTRVFSTNLTLYSWMTSIHLFCNTFALVGFLSFTCLYTEYDKKPVVQKLMLVIFVLAAIAGIGVLSNPFHNFVVDFRFRVSGDYGYGYPYSVIKYNQEHWFYFYNLAVDYVSALGIIILLLKKTFSVPREFRNQYAYASIAIGLIIFANALSIFAFNNDGLLNYAVGFYGLMCIFLYQYAYNYSDHMKLNYFKTSVFENVGQGLVLFDYSGRMILCNEKAKSMLTAVDFGKPVTRASFEHACNITLDENKNLDEMSVQCYMSTEYGFVPLRCDFRRLKGDGGRQLGTLFAFTDVQLETDTLTGYHKWDSFRNFIRDNENGFTLPMTVVVADINGLNMLNSVAGREAGDKQLKVFANMLRSNFPKDTYFGRGEGANLILLNHNMDVNTIIDTMAYVRANFEGSFAYTQEFVTEENPGILKAIESAEVALKQKKLMDENSSHSEILDSLLRTLYGTDSTLEKQSMQMRKWCDELGRQMNLTSRQQGDLSLLCMLHDVGNIGVPKEIMNKPSALTSEEWRHMKFHVERGHAIAKSSSDLASVADLVMHHHERWDGKGYPSGLCREEIPLLSRIICVVDAYNAMLNPRPYRPAMTKDVAVSELRSCSGTQFDPAVVNEFLKIVESSEGEYSGSVAAEPENDAAIPNAAPSVEKRGSVLPQKQVEVLPYTRMILNTKVDVISVDEQFERFTGYSREDIRERGLNFQDLIPPEDLTDYLRDMTEDITQNKVTCIKHRLRRKDGAVIYVAGYGRQYYDSAAREDRSEVIVTYASPFTSNL